MWSLRLVKSFLDLYGDHLLLWEQPWSHIPAEMGHFAGITVSTGIATICLGLGTDFCVAARRSTPRPVYLLSMSWKSGSLPAASKGTFVLRKPPSSLFSPWQHLPGAIGRIELFLPGVLFTHVRTSAPLSAPKLLLAACWVPLPLPPVRVWLEVNILRGRNPLPLAFCLICLCSQARREAVLWHGGHTRRPPGATDRQMIEKPTHSSRAGLSWKKSGFGEMQKTLRVQAGPTPGLGFVRAGVALSPQNSGPWKGTKQNQPQHPLGRQGSWISKILGFQGILTYMAAMGFPGEFIYPCQVSTFPTGRTGPC